MPAVPAACGQYDGLAETGTLAMTSQASNANARSSGA